MKNEIDAQIGFQRVDVMVFYDGTVSITKRLDESPVGECVGINITNASAEEIGREVIAIADICN